MAAAQACLCHLWVTSRRDGCQQGEVGEASQARQAGSHRQTAVLCSEAEALQSREANGPVAHLQLAGSGVMV